jgi:hypothetical protein
MQVAGGGTGLSAVGTSGYVLASNGSANVYINGTGLSGYSGYSGTNGATGTSGYSGATGSNGSAGTSGYSGYSGSAASVNAAQLARAWVNFTGGDGNTAGTVVASYNVSSITVNGTGDYTVNFTSTLPNANYALAGSASRSDPGNGPFSLCINTSTTPTTSAVRVITGYGGSRASAGSPNNCVNGCVVIFD